MRWEGGVLSRCDERPSRDHDSLCETIPEAGVADRHRCGDVGAARAACWVLWIADCLVQLNVSLVAKRGRCSCCGSVILWEWCAGCRGSNDSNGE